MARALTRARLWDLLRRAQGIVRLERGIDAQRSAIAAPLERIEAAGATLERRLGAIEADIAGLRAQLAAVDERLSAEVMEALRAVVARDADNREAVWDARAGAGYAEPFEHPSPLVSIVVPTLSRPELLRTRCLPSLLAQTHTSIEVIVVGDHAGPEVEAAVRSIPDPRLAFHNLSQRLPLPPDRTRRWHVGSVMARNEGFRLARGHWRLSFDDDDALAPGAVERLLAAARERRAEVAYGQMRMHRPDGDPILIGEFPPRHSHFGLQSALVHRDLGFFERDLSAAAFGVPNDVFMFEAMLRAGVRFAMIQDVVCDYYPSQLWPAADPDG